MIHRRYNPELTGFSSDMPKTILQDWSFGEVFLNIKIILETKQQLAQRCALNRKQILKISYLKSYGKYGTLKMSKHLLNGVHIFALKYSNPYGKQKCKNAIKKHYQQP